MSVRTPSIALVILASLLAVAMLRWASACFIPLMIGVLLSYALSPVIDALHRVRVPRALSAGVLILGLLSGAAASAYAFSADVNTLVDTLPAAAAKLREVVRARAGGGQALNTVQM